MDDISDKASELYKEGKAKVTDAYKTAKDKADDVSQHVKETTSHLYKESKDKINDIHDSVNDNKDELVKAIKRKPLQSVLIAGGIGFLLSKLLKK